MSSSRANKQCPNCNKIMKPLDDAFLADKPTTPPYVCSPCARGWWEAELTTDARKRWRGPRRDFGRVDGPDHLQLAVLSERDTAVEKYRNRRRS